MKKKPFKWIAAAVILGGVVASSPNSPVNADTFTPLPAPPSVEVTAVPESVDPGNRDADPGNRDAVVEVTATVGLEATVDDLDTITLCLYKKTGSSVGIGPTDPNVILSGNASCTGEGRDPANTFLVTWTEADDGTPATNLTTDAGDFAVTYPSPVAIGEPDARTEEEKESTWELDGSSVVTTRANVAGTGDYGAFNDTHQALTITFAFIPSEVMLAGSDWEAVVTATYLDSTCNVSPNNKPCSESGVTISGSDSDSLGNVSYYSVIKSGNASANDRLNYGFLLTGATSSVVQSDAVTYVTNAISQVTVTGSNFSKSVDVLTLVTTGSGEGGALVSGQVKIECRDAKFEDEDAPSDSGKTFIAVPQTGTTTELGIDRNATSETADNVNLRCKLTYGGGAKTALQTYTNTVTVGVVVKPTPAPSEE